MGRSKGFTDSELVTLAKVFSVLSQTSRLKILRSLVEGEKCVTEIINATGLMQANVSKQIKILESAGIVGCRPAGLQRYYRIVDPSILEICEAICKNRE